MKKKLPHSVKDIKGAVALAELRRAHYIIVILSFSLVVLLIATSIEAIKFDPILSTVAIILLCVVGLSSLVTAIALSKSPKK